MFDLMQYALIFYDFQLILARMGFEGEVFHNVLRMHTFVPQIPSLLSPGSSCRLR